MISQNFTFSRDISRQLYFLGSSIFPHHHFFMLQYSDHHLLFKENFVLILIISPTTTSSAIAFEANVGKRLRKKPRETSRKDIFVCVRLRDRIDEKSRIIPARKKKNKSRGRHFKSRLCCFDTTRTTHNAHTRTRTRIPHGKTRTARSPVGCDRDREFTAIQGVPRCRGGVE
jgi:hypothetical protein